VVDNRRLRGALERQNLALLWRQVADDPGLTPPRC
jgi:hypothetical protein